MEKTVWNFCIPLAAIVLRVRTLNCVKTIINLFLESVSVFLLDNRIMLENTLLSTKLTNNNNNKKKKKKEREKTKLKSDNNNMIKTVIFSNGARLGEAFCFLCSDDLTRKS